MRNRITVFCLFSFLFAIPQASAHYLWIVIDAKADKANIYFEEGPAAGDGHYLDHFTDSSKTWFRTVEKIKPQLIETEDIRQGKKRWLQATVPGEAPRAVDCYGKFGVYQYGETFVLLHYYARSIDAKDHDALHELSRAEHMDLELIPHDEGDSLEVKVLWRGKPAAGRMVYIRGPNRFRKNVKTDAKGVVSLQLAGEGRYTFRTSVEEDIAGRDGDQDYSLIRHNGTLLMELPLK